MTPLLTAERFALLLGLSFFFGFAFEEFYAKQQQKPPGGVRTFPLLALAGALLFLIEPVHALPFAIGLLALGGWQLAFFSTQLRRDDSGQVAAELIIPVSNMLVFVLGPAALVAPPWMTVGATVAAVLLLGARERLHGLARRLPEDEITTLGKFLILTGIVLPLLPDQPVTSLTPITPYKAWLAVVAISGLSYASYLVQRYVSPRQGVLVAALLGGLYSSTATTVVLARRARQAASGQLQAGILLATTVMYLRVGVVVAVFNLALAAALAPWLAGLAAAGFGLAALLYLTASPAPSAEAEGGRAPDNPLELTAAAIFAALFVVISLASGWVKAAFGQAGIDVLAVIVGMADIDPFVLSLAQGGVAGLTMTQIATAILIATASNNLLKAGYTVIFAGPAQGVRPAGALLLLTMATAGAILLRPT